MVISTKKLGIFALLYVHIVDFSTTFEFLMILSEPIGRGESLYAKIWSTNFCIHSAIQFKLSWYFGWQFLQSNFSQSWRAVDLI